MQLHDHVNSVLLNASGGRRRRDTIVTPEPELFTRAKHPASPADGLASYLASFPETPGYLDFARFAPPSHPAAEAAATWWQRSMHADGIDEAAASARARAAVAAVTGFAAENVALAPSTSHGMLQVAFAVDGGDVAIAPGEFPAHLYPWWRAEELGLLRVRPLPGELLDPVTPQRVAAALTPGTTAVAVSAVDFRTGWRADLAGIRAVIGERLLIVDGIQGIGAVDLPWHHADALVAGGQKWLRAGWGTGFVALSARGAERLRPRLAGWTGVSEARIYDGMRHPLAPDATAFTATNGSPVSAHVLAAALELIAEAGVPEIAGRIAERTAELDTLLRGRGFDVVSPLDPLDRAGIVVARIGDAPARVDGLAAAGVRVTAHGADRVRFSVHATTTSDDLVRAAAL